MARSYRTIILICLAFGALTLAYISGSPGTGGGGPARETEFPLDVEEFAPETVASFLEDNLVQLVDARSREEVDVSSIPGAIWIPLSEIKSRELDRDAYPQLESEVPIVVYCKSGVRSLVAVRILRRAGFATSYSLTGGISAWERQGYPLYRGERSK